MRYDPLFGSLLSYSQIGDSGSGFDVVTGLLAPVGIALLARHWR